MKKMLSIVSWMILVGMLVSAILCANKIFSSATNQLILLAGTILWFIATPLWMKRT